MITPVKENIFYLKENNNVCRSHSIPISVSEENIARIKNRKIKRKNWDNLVSKCEHKDTPDIRITLRNGVDVIPKSGGEIPYSITFTNTDFNEFFKEYITWSVLTMPNGDNYSIFRPRKIFLRAGEKMLNPIPKLSIPSWFPHGEYILTLHIEDREGIKPTKRISSLTFKKLSD